MSPDSVPAWTDLVNALTRLIQTIGAGWFSLILLLAALLFVVLPWIREHQRNKRVDIVIEHKEREVLRLSEDNRKYREVYLAKLGFPPDALAGDAEDSRAAKAERKEHPKERKP